MEANCKIGDGMAKPDASETASIAEFEAFQRRQAAELEPVLGPDWRQIISPEFRL